MAVFLADGAPVVAVGASAGGIQALQQLLKRLQPEWGIAFIVVLHRASVEQDARLETLLASWTTVPLVKAADGDRVIPGRGVVCPADVHIVVEGDCYRLNTGPQENRMRPSIDVTFRSIAQSRGARGGAIVLSGVLDDGAAGVRAVRANGGLTIAQDPREALHTGMPRSAVAAGADHVLAIAEMPEVLQQFAATVAPSPSAEPGSVNGSELTRMTCPDCGGVLAEQTQGDVVSYRCRVGHAYSLETLHEAKGAEIEDALWTAVQVLEEQVDLTDRVARRAHDRGDDQLASQMARRAKRLRTRAHTVLGALPSINDAIRDSETRSEID